MKKFIVTIYFGAKTSGGPFGDIADTLKIRMLEKQMEDCIEKLTNNPYVSITTETGLRVINTTKILYFDIEKEAE